MLAHPSVRNDPITPWSRPINHHHHTNTSANLDNLVQIQDNQLPPDLLHDIHQQQAFFQQQQQQQQLLLESPFQSPVRLDHLSSPPSSASASPIFSSPAFSSRSPATAVSSDFPTVLDGGLFETPSSMSATSSFNPSIHIQHSSPSPFSTPQFATTGSPMLAQHGIASNNHGWDGDANIQLLSPARAQNGLAQRSGLQGGAHERASSGSSGTTDSTSPQAAVFNHNQNSSSFSPSTTNLNGFTDSYQNSNKALPTPVQTPVQNSFLAAPFQNYDPSSQNGDNAEAERAMRQAVMEQQQNSQQQSQQLPQQAAADDEAPFHYSMAPSASSLSHHNSPVTPQTTTYDDFDDGSKAVVRGEDRSPDFDRWMDEYLQLDTRSDFNGQGAATVPMGVPKLNRTISDIYQDELYNATVVPTPQARKPNPSQAQTTQPMVAPYRNLFADRLQAASQGHLSARSQSPVNNRERSPFRQGSPLAPDFRTARLQQSGLATTMQLPHTNGLDLGNQQDNQGEPKTISPKDALLEYHEGPEDTAMPSLFPTSQAGPDYQVGGNGGGDNFGLRRQSASAFQPTQNYSQMESFPSQFTHQAAGLQQPFNFLQQAQNAQQQQNNLMQQTPNFSTSLPSTTTITATAPSTAAPAQQTQTEAARRPDDTSSDSGTYTCTYHGCTLRFETPAKLQRHKREAHRQTTMAGHLAGRDSHGNPVPVRNSQAGPHKCERINPSTGKPCNSIFSRPYDLTRHEDTIHNARKQKVRCHLCTEEKTFSRNDALTRHMRVVHPDVDWPGKQRRKGRE